MKQLNKTRNIIEKIHASAGPDVDVENLAVYENISLNTLPIKKTNTIFDGAIVSAAVLNQMANYVNTYEGGVPLHVMHNDYTLPVGKVFYGESGLNTSGHHELRTLFYVDKSSETDILAKLESGVIDEVSVGLATKHIFCSECDFDYLGSEANFDHILEATCDNGHVVGQNGCFTKLEGLESFQELSLVNRGAANKAKIVGPSQALLAQENFKQLAASGRHPQEKILFAIKTQPEKETKPVSDIDLNKLIGELSDLKASDKILNASITSKDAKIVELEAKISTLEAAANGETEEIKSKLAQLTAANEFIQDFGKRTLIASSKKIEDLPKDPIEAMALITELQANLSAVIPVDGASLGSETLNEPNSKKVRSLSAFTSNRKENY